MPRRVGVFVIAATLMTAWTIELQAAPEAGIQTFVLSDESQILFCAPPTEARLPLRIRLHRGRDFQYLRLPDWSFELPVIRDPHGIYYALVAEREGRLFVFLPWNEKYFWIESTTGKLLTSGEGHAPLREFKGLSPVKLYMYERQSVDESSDAGADDLLPGQSSEP